MVCDIEEMILKPVKYSIFGFTHILYMKNIALQGIYKITAFAIPIHHSIEGMCGVMSGYIVIMAGSCTELRCFGTITLGL